jgi:hypothetical protein
MRWTEVGITFDDNREFFHYCCQISHEFCTLYKYNSVMADAIENWLTTIDSDRVNPSSQS